MRRPATGLRDEVEPAKSNPAVGVRPSGGMPGSTGGAEAGAGAAEQVEERRVDVRRVGRLRGPVGPRPDRLRGLEDADGAMARAVTNSLS